MCYLLKARGGKEKVSVLETEVNIGVLPVDKTAGAVSAKKQVITKRTASFGAKYKYVGGDFSGSS